MTNTVDPDEKAHYEPSHLYLQSLQIQVLLYLALYELKIVLVLFNHNNSKIVRLHKYVL